MRDFPSFGIGTRILSEALQLGHQGLGLGSQRLQPVHDVAPHAGIGAVAQQGPHLLALSQAHQGHRRTSLPLGQVVLFVHPSLRMSLSCHSASRSGTVRSWWAFSLSNRDGKGLLFRIQQQVGQEVGIIAGVVGQDVRRQRPFGFGIVSYPGRSWRAGASASPARAVGRRARDRGRRD